MPRIHLVGPPPEIHLEDEGLTDFTEALDLAHYLDLFRRIQEGLVTPIQTPWPDVNNKIDGGLWPEVTTLTGQPGDGKTQWAWDLMHYAAQRDTACLYVPLELPREQVAARILGIDAGIPWSDIYRGRNAACIQAAERVVRHANTLPIRLAKLPPGGWKANRLLKTVREMQNRFPDKKILVVLDFLQRVSPNHERDTLQTTISHAAYHAVDVCNAANSKWNVSILLISSVGRDNYPLVDERKRKGDDTLPSVGEDDASAWLGIGKWSGDVEYAAATALALTRDGEGDTWLAIAKNRTGKTAWVPMSFDGTTFR